MSVSVGGTYKHFKGNLYKVITLGKDAETLTTLVVYSSLKTGEVWVRKESEWEETVSWPDGTEGPRFLVEDQP